MIRTSCTALSLIALTVACAPPPEPAPTVDHGAAVASLADEVWERLRASSPYLLVRDGELIGDLPDLTPEQAAADVAFSRSVLERLERIPFEALDHEAWITASMLRWDAEQAIALEPFYWLGFPFTPYVAGFGFNFVNGQIAAYPFTDPAVHPEKYLTLLGEYADQIEQMRAHVEGQIERGIFLSRHALPGVTGLFRALREQAPGLMTVAPDRLAALLEVERGRFEQGVAEAIDARVVPAFDAFLDLLASERYAESAPDAVGLAHYPDGEALYRTLVGLHTTSDVTAEALHDLGLRRVAEIEDRMAAIRAEVGFEGSKADFHAKLRSDPQFFAKTPAEVEARFDTYIARIEPLIGDYFRTLPKAPYGVERLDPAAEGSMTFGYYSSPTPDRQTGLYYYNGSELDERPQIWAGPLIYHELIPGHHFHIALQNENTALPKYRRNYLGASAFTEGWGNYGAFLAAEMGLLDDPYDRYGAALFDIFISARLVLDTGMNLKGWTLEEGRAYMREHTFQSETEIASETLRYATDLHAQALAYKSGLEDLVAFRGRARALAGDRFDLRDFHEAVLGSGSMPMVVLAEHIERSFASAGE